MEITDDKLLKIALVTSLIGLIGLIVFTPTIEVKEVDIKDINRGMIGWITPGLFLQLLLLCIMSTLPVSFRYLCSSFARQTGTCTDPR